ncbi:MAG: transposase [Methylomonas sp.]
MLPPFELSEPECITLQELAEHHPYPDFRRRALGLLALAKGHSFPVVADILGVTLPTPYNWAKAWRNQGVVGLLNGHQGGAPIKLRSEWLDTAERIARESPCTLAEIDRQLREIHPDAATFSLDALARHLKKRGLSFTRTRLSLKKNATPNASRHRKIT